MFGFFVSIQNAKMIHYLLAKHGIPSIEPAQFAQLPLYLAERQAVVSVGMPPYAHWQPNPAIGRIPPHRTDAGCYFISEVLGARSMTRSLNSSTSPTSFLNILCCSSCGMPRIAAQSRLSMD